MEGEMRIVLLGKTGCGKSSSGNTILGDSSSTKFVINSSPNSVTSKCEVLTGLRPGKGTKIQIIDTPGFFDTRTMPDEKSEPEILNCITTCSPGPHAFIIVLRVDRYTQQEAANVEKITTHFGEDALKYSAVLFIDGDRLNESQTIEQFVEQSQALKKLVEKCGGRCHVIDNRYWNQEHEYRSNRIQVEKLLNTIEEMVKNNGGGCYTNKMLEAVEEAIQREEEEIRKKNPKEKSAFKIRAEAIGRFIKKLLAKSAGLAAGTLIGALLGIGAAVVAVAALIGLLSKGGGVVAAVEGITGGLGAATTGIWVTGSIVAGAGVIGAIGGGYVGFQAVQDGDGVCDAVKKAVTANWKNTKKVVAGAKGLVSQLSEAQPTSSAPQ